MKNETIHITLVKGDLEATTTLVDSSHYVEALDSLKYWLEEGKEGFYTQQGYCVHVRAANFEKHTANTEIGRLKSRCHDLGREKQLLINELRSLKDDA